MPCSMLYEIFNDITNVNEILSTELSGFLKQTLFLSSYLIQYFTPLTTAIWTLRIREVTPFRTAECSKSYCESLSFKASESK